LPDGITITELAFVGVKDAISTVVALADIKGTLISTGEGPGEKTELLACRTSDGVPFTLLSSVSVYDTVSTGLTFGEVEATALATP